MSLCEHFIKKGRQIPIYEGMHMTEMRREEDQCTITGEK